jgi:hypothetical protein
MGRGVSAEHKRLSKLPPRLAKVKAEEMKERKFQKMAAAKEHRGHSDSKQSDVVAGQQQSQEKFVIENWDNDIASGIPVTSAVANQGNFNMNYVNNIQSSLA